MPDNLFNPIKYLTELVNLSKLNVKRTQFIC